jgi:uncharacterized protein (TIGR03437 family)
MGMTLARILPSGLLSLSLLPSLAAAPMLRLSNTAVGPVSVATGVAGPVQVVEAYNAGDGSLNLDLSSSVNWIVPSIGAARPCTSLPDVCLPAQIGLQTASLAKGMHTGVVTVSDPSAVDAPQTITVTVQIGGGVPDRVDFFVAPNGSIDATRFTTNSAVASQVSTQVGGPWLSFSVDGVGTFRFPVPYRITSIHLSGMAEGDYPGSVTITSSTFAPDNKTVQVVLHVTSQPIAEIAPERLKFRVLQDSSQTTQFLTVSNRGLGALNVTAVAANTSSGGSWLSVENASGFAYQVTADPAGLAPGSYQGSVAVTTNAANGPLMVPVTLEIVAPGPPLALFGGVVNNATFEGGDPVSQGDICAVFGEQFSYADPQEGTELPLVTQLGGATVFVNDRAVPLYFSSYGQVNFQMPYETPAGAALVRVERDGQPGNAISVRVVSRAARILRLGIADYGIIVNQDGSFPIPGATAAQFAVNGHAARVGDVLVIFAIGIGQTTPAVASGEPAPGEEPLARIVPPPRVFFGGSTLALGVPADALYVGLTPFFVGLYQINVPIPLGTPLGDEVTVQLAGSGVVSNQVHIAVQ